MCKIGSNDNIKYNYVEGIISTHICLIQANSFSTLSHTNDIEKEKSHKKKGKKKRAKKRKERKREREREKEQKKEKMYCIS